MKVTHIAIAATLLAVSGTAAAQSATDMRCVILSNGFAHQAKEGEAQKLAEASLYFYLGRISGQTSTAQLKAVFEQQSKTITDANAPGLMDSCVKALQSEMQLVQGLNGQPAPPAKPPQK